jgi:uncharacterized protein DUF6438/carboxypeptidase family protein
MGGDLAMRARDIPFAMMLAGIMISACTIGNQVGAVAGHVSGACVLSVGGAQSKVLAVPNAHISLKSDATGTVRIAQTNPRGDFEVEGLVPGRYALSLDAKPFARQVYAVQVRRGVTTDASTQLISSPEGQFYLSVSACPGSLMGRVAPSDMRQVIIRLRRTACYGTCPAYGISLYGDGRVEYEGIRYVSTVGIREYRVEASAVARIVKRFSDTGFFNYCGSYRVQVTDQPSTITTFRMGNYSKSVSVYGDSAPEGLEELDAAIETGAKVGPLVR